MKSTLTLSGNAPKATLVEPNHLDNCTALAWLELVAVEVNSLTGDDWLALCDDIDTGELYRDWFVWQDREVSNEWEAYDPLTDRRLVEADLAILKAKIDQIEEARNAEIMRLEYC